MMCDSRPVSRASPVFRWSRGRAVAALATAATAALAATRPAVAATLYWDPSASGPTSGASGGTGTWDLTTPSWFPGTAPDVAWPNTASSLAAFNGTAGTVTLGTSLTAQGLAFNTAGYAVNTGANTLTLAGAGIVAATGAGAVTTVAGTVVAVASQTWNATAGATLNFNGTLNANVASGVYYGLTAGGGGTINISGGTAAAPTNVTGVFLGTTGTTNISGVFNTSSSNANNTKFDINNGGVVNWNATGTQAGGYTGLGDGSNGFLNLNGGTFTVAPTLGLFVATGNVSSGTPAVATLNVSGGNLVVTTNANIYVGDSYNGGAGGTGTGTVNVNSGTFTTGTTTGSFVLGGSTNTGTGTVNLNAGGTLTTARAVTAGSSAKGTINFNGGTLQSSGGAMSLSTLTGNVLDGGAVVDTNGFNASIASNLVAGGTGVGGLIKLGVGALTLSGTNTYTGNTTVSAGVLAATVPAALPGYATAGRISVASGAYLSFGYNGSSSTFTAASIATAQSNVALAAGSGLGVDVASGTTATYASNLGGFANFIKTGVGTLTLSGADTYTGSTTVAAGVLAEPSAATLGSTSSLVLGYGIQTGEYSSTGAGETISLPIALGGTTGGGILDASATGPVVVNGAFSVPNAGAKTLILQGASTAANTLASTVGNGSGTVALTKAGTGTWVAAGSNTYTGITTVVAGNLQAAATNAFGTAGSISVNGAGVTTLSTGGTLQMAGGITLPNAVNVSARNDPTTTTTTPQIENVSGNNTLGGNVTIVNVGGNGTVVELDAGTLTLAGGLGNATTTGYARNFYFYGPGNAAITGTLLAGTGGNSVAITKYGTGTVAVSGAANTFTGGTFIYGGTVRANATAALGTGTTLINQSGGVLAGTGTTGGPVTILSGGTITAGSGATTADTIGALGTGTLNVSGGQYVVKLDGASSTPGSAGTGSAGTPGTVGDELVLSGLSFNGSATLTVNPVLLTTPSVPGTYSYLIATAPAGSFGSASAVSSQFSLNQTAPGVGTYSLSTDPGGDSLYLDFADTIAAPEPTSLLLAGLAVGPLALGRRRRRGVAGGAGR